MSWQCYITDAQTGRIGQPIDIPNFSWAVNINDSGLSTTQARKVGQDSVSNITVPWQAVPGNTALQRYEALEPGAKALALFWQTEEDLQAGSFGVPVLWGVITNRTDDWDSTSVSVSSVYALLANRYCVREKAFHDGTSTDSITFKGMSMRGIASEVGWLCTNAKQGGELPVDWSYRGERHVRQPGQDASVHTRTYTAYDIANLSGQDIFDKLSTVMDGVDMQWRPYLTADGQYVREKFLAGSDQSIYLCQKAVYAMSAYPGGGTIENLQVSYAQPVMRVYGTGAGQDKTTQTAYAEDMSLTQGDRGLILTEQAYSDSDAQNLNVLKAATRGQLAAQDRPIMQVTGDIHLNDAHVPQPGSLWPGELVSLDLQGHPSLPDGVYKMRLMEMSGDSSDKVALKFDTLPVPTKASTPDIEYASNDLGLIQPARAPWPTAGFKPGDQRQSHVDEQDPSQLDITVVSTPNWEVRSSQADVRHLDPTQQYRVTFWYRYAPGAPHLTGGQFALGVNRQGVAFWGKIIQFADFTHEWQKAEYTFGPSANLGEGLTTITTTVNKTGIESQIQVRDLHITPVASRGGQTAKPTAEQYGLFGWKTLGYNAGDVLTFHAPAKWTVAEIWRTDTTLNLPHHDPYQTTSRRVMVRGGHRYRISVDCMTEGATGSLGVQPYGNWQYNVEAMPSEGKWTTFSRTFTAPVGQADHPDGFAPVCVYQRKDATGVWHLRNFRWDDVTFTSGGGLVDGGLTWHQIGFDTDLTVLTVHTCGKDGNVESFDSTLSKTSPAAIRLEPNTTYVFSVDAQITNTTSIGKSGERLFAQVCAGKWWWVDMWAGDALGGWKTFVTKFTTNSDLAPIFCPIQISAVDSGTRTWQLRNLCIYKLTGNSDQ